jgi:lipid A 3-O-deacylase
LNVNLKVLIFAFFAATAIAVAQPGTESSNSTKNTADDPVAEVRNGRLWEMGFFANYGNGVGDRSDFRFFAAGFQAGKPLTPVLRAGILSGQFEFAGNIQPIWQSYTPTAGIQLHKCQNPDGDTVPCYLPVGGGTFTGLSVTPVILRWNFLTPSKRIQPWFQGAGGLIYTTHKYPPDVLFPHGLPGGTSVWNFSPQGGVGIHWFTRPKRSVDLAVNAVHISSASLGDRNPGINALVQIQAGYTWWK